MKGDVIVEYAPISERMWSKGDIATIRNGQIRLGGCWFNFDDRYIVTACNYYTASCFQKPNGEYLSLDENRESMVAIKARNEEEAFEKLAEQQQVDSELTIEERWNVYPSTENHYNECHLPKL